LHFQSVHQAIAFFVYRNPARLKRQNLLEPERGGNSFGDFDSDDIWAAVALAIKNVLEEQSAHDVKCFRLLYLTERSQAPSLIDVARLQGVSDKKLKRRMYRILDRLQNELERFDLFEEEPEENLRTGE